MSGFGAPARTESPNPASTNGVAVPATTLPFRISSSIGAGLLVMRSAGPLELSRRSSAAASSWMTVTLWPLARSNAVASSRTPGVAPWLVRTMSSAAPACGSDPAAPRLKPATVQAAANVLPAIMTSSSRISAANLTAPQPDRGKLMRSCDCGPARVAGDSAGMAQPVDGLRAVYHRAGPGRPRWLIRPTWLVIPIVTSAMVEARADDCHPAPMAIIPIAFGARSKNETHLFPAWTGGRSVVRTRRRHHGHDLAIPARARVIGGKD